MEFEWDTRKAAQNFAKHGVPFEYAARIFLDPHRLDSEDERRDVRLISARKANEREQRQYNEALSA